MSANELTFSQGPLQARHGWLSGDGTVQPGRHSRASSRQGDRDRRGYPDQPARHRAADDQARLLVASVDRAREMGINWWESDASLSSDAQALEKENQSLRERLERLEQAAGLPSPRASRRVRPRQAEEAVGGGRDRRQESRSRAAARAPAGARGRGRSGRARPGSQPGPGPGRAADRGATGGRAAGHRRRAGPSLARGRMVPPEPRTEPHESRPEPPERRQTSAPAASAPATAPEAGEAWWTYCVMWDEDAVEVASDTRGRRSRELG